MRVRAYDNGSPALGNITVVAVTVERNLFAPVLQGQTVITIRVPETKELGVPIATISANDADSQVISMCSHHKVNTYNQDYQVFYKCSCHKSNVSGILQVFLSQK